MKIGIIATHSFPVPYTNHSGDLVYAELARTFDEMGHEVTFFAPDGSYMPPHGQRLSLPCSWGTMDPLPEDCEQQCFDKYRDILYKQDIVHDFSCKKRIAENLYNAGYKNVISSLFGGDYFHPHPHHNIVVCSEAMRQRSLRGATDWENVNVPYVTDIPKSTIPVQNARLCYLGIDTSFYIPTYKKENFYLWMGRWHPIRGYCMAIDIARTTGINLVIAGEHPDNEVQYEHRLNCIYWALELAKDLPNVRFEWLPSDPEHHTVKRDLFQKAKAFLYPVQFNEPFGLSQPEALACGTPIIGSNLGSVPEIVEHGVTGYICNDTVEDYARAIKMIDNIKLENCREQAVKRFSLHTMAFSYMKLYREVLAGNHW